MSNAPENVIKKKNRWFPWAWSTRGFALGVNALILMQVSFYATESAGLSIGLVSTLVLVSKLFDGITDLVAGFIIDKTKTRWGKARPYELFLIPTWILTILLFSTPTAWSTAGKAVYFFVLYLLINAVTVTFLSSSEAVYLGRATLDEGLRAKALTLAGVLATIFPTITAIILPILMNTWGRQPGGWTKIMLVFGIPFTIIGLIRFFCIKELPEEELKAIEGENVKQSTDLTFKETLKNLFQNKYIFLMAGVGLVCQILNGINSTVGSYFFEYYIGDLTQMSVINMLGLISPFALFLFPLAVRKWGGMNFVKAGLVLAIVGNVIKFFAGKSIPGILIGSFIAAVPGPNAIMMIGSMFVIQCMDYGQWKTGVRIEGPVNCVYGFATKVGSGISAGVAGAILGAAGFIEGATELGVAQPASALSAIQWCFSLVPAILCVGMLVVLHFYDLEKNYDQIKARLTGK